MLIALLHCTEPFAVIRFTGLVAPFTGPVEHGQHNASKLLGYLDYLDGFVEVLRIRGRATVSIQVAHFERAGLYPSFLLLLEGFA